MGATSTQGTGPGATWGAIKGPNNGRNIYVPLLSPHVVAAGEVTLSGGVATVTFPEALENEASKYVVILTSRNSAVNGDAAVVTAKTDSDSKFASFAIAGTGTQVVGWAVISAGF